MAGRTAERMDLAPIVAAYRAGASCQDIAIGTNRSHHTIRRYLVEAGEMRDRTQAMRLAFAQGKMDDRRGRKGVPNTPQGRENNRQAAALRAAKYAKGYRLTPSGYYEFTRGELAGKLVHVALMEARIGRPLQREECVHHIDGDRSNNAEDNLALMTRAAHSRLHRREDDLSGKVRPRNNLGQFEGK